MDFKTPGVFVEEVALFPPSIAPVATGIPAFIGHTERTTDSEAVSLINRPIRLTSLLDFTSMFGGEYTPASYTVQVDPDAAFAILDVTPLDDQRYYLFDALRHYFDNGGGPCYVVTVGDYETEIIYGTDTTGLRGGLRALEKVDEPTILVAPDAVVLEAVQAGNLHKDLIAQCSRLKDRFAVLDLVEGYLPPGDDDGPIQRFRDEVGTENLKYAAAYYPWLISSYQKAVGFDQLVFVDDQDPAQPVPDATIDSMTGDPVLDGLVTDMRARLADEQRVFSKVSTVALDRNTYDPLRTHFDNLRGDVAAATSNTEVRAAFRNLIGFVRELALAFQDLEDDPNNPPEMTAVLTSLAADTSLIEQITELIAFEKNADVMDKSLASRSVTDVESDYAALDETDWIGGVTVASIPANTDFSDGIGTLTERATRTANATELSTAFDAIAQAYTSLIQNALFLSSQAEQLLFEQHPFFRAVRDRIRGEMSLTPPSGAAAGVYAATDRSRGVWKAPANVSLRSVVGPSYKLDDREQGALNVHPSGKSINAIRAFTGKGILVWGARTLAGNDNEWRYINVRRFFTFVEESTKKATEPFVFEANDANTWVRVRAMIENFLTIQWRQGALVGATPKDAFYVKVGLGETMTAQDILEGRMIVEIGMAAVRPGEFIVLRFSHKMQES